MCFLEEGAGAGPGAPPARRSEEGRFIRLTTWWTSRRSSSAVVGCFRDEYYEAAGHSVVVGCIDVLSTIKLQYKTYTHVLQIDYISLGTFFSIGSLLLPNPHHDDVVEPYATYGD